MPVNTREIIELLCTVAEEEKLRVTVIESIKGGLITGATTTAGGLVLGPLGLPVGAIIGSIIAAALSKNKFTSAVEVIKNMEQEKKDMLAQNVQQIMASIDVTDIVAFGALIAGNTSIRGKVVTAVVDCLRTEMSREIENL